MEACDKPHYENVPFEVPSSWVWCKLHNIIQITNGRSQKYVENVNGKYPIYGSGGVIGKAVDYLCEAGSTIIGRKGTINNPLFVEERFWNIDTAFGMKPMYAISDLYFFYFCQYFDFSKLDKSTAVPSLTQSAIGEVFIPIPPINEQKRITDGISYWLGFIDTLESNLINLQLAIKQTKSKILNLAIHGKLVPQDPTDEPASELLKRINPKAEIACDNGHYQKNKQFEIPSTWVLCKLGAVNEIARGGSPRPIKDYLTNDANGINWIKIGDTTKDGKYINSVKEKIRPEGVKKSRLVHKGDFLLTNSMSYGRPYILNVDGCIHDGWLVISPIGKAYTSNFLYYLLSSSFAYEQFTNVASGGVVTNLNSDKVADTIFPLPPYTEQHRIVAKIEEIFAELDAIEASL